MIPTVSSLASSSTLTAYSTNGPVSDANANGQQITISESMIVKHPPTTTTASTNLAPQSANFDFGQYFVNQLLPHVKSFAFTWFHLQAAKRKHFKSEEKRMSYQEEYQLKQRLMNEPASAKIKWAVRLLMKLRKDIEKNHQRDLVQIISTLFSGSGGSSVGDAASAAANTKCVLSNPDMKGKMRRIDCLRQSDKVWRLDLVMVVLFKGIPLESSDGERLDKLPECQHAQLCVNPAHALLNVRDLEIYLANYINYHNSIQFNSNNRQQPSILDVETRLNCKRNISSESVFTTGEFITLSDVSITSGATESDLKHSVLSCGGSGTSNNHAFSDDENDNEPVDDKSVLQSVIAFQENQHHQQQQHLSNDVINKGIESVSTSKDDTVVMPQKKKVKSTHSLLSPHKSNIKINELIEKMQQQNQQLNQTSSSGVLVEPGKQTDVTKSSSSSSSRKSNKKENEQNNQPPSSTIVGNSSLVTGTSANSKVKRRRFSNKTESMSETLKTSLITDENAVDNVESVAAANNATKSTSDASAISSNCQPNSNTAEVMEEHSSCSTLSQQDEEIKELLMSKKISTNGHQHQSGGFQLIDSSSTQKKLDQELKQLLEKEKQTTADLFMQLMKAQEDQSLRTPSGTITSSSAAFLTQNENSLLNELVNLNNSNCGVSSGGVGHFILSQPGNKSATPVFELLMSPSLFNTIMPSSGGNGGTNTITSNKTSSTTTPPTISSSPTTCIDPTASAGGGGGSSQRKSPASFKKAAKHQSIRNIISSLNNGNCVNSNNNTITAPKTTTTNINTSLISALRFDSNSNGSLDDLNNSGRLNTQSPIEPQAQNLINKLISISPTLAHALQQQQQHQVVNQQINSKSSQKASNTECDDEVKKELSKAGGNKSDGSSSSNNSKGRQRGGSTTPTVIINSATSNNSSSPPPPPPIVSTPGVVGAGTSNNNNGAGGHSSSSLTAPSPTKLLQFYPSYSPLSAPDLHRPIPIIQKTPVVIDPSSSHHHHQTTQFIRQPIAAQQQSQQQQQATLLTTLRSNSINSNNSPLMFNVTNGAVNNSLLSNNLFANYPNISPANGSASPTSNLFPSITSLFQSPIGTPRVTPTPTQHFAAYLFNEDQISLIFSNNNNNINNTGQCHPTTNGTHSTSTNNTTTTGGHLNHHHHQNGNSSAATVTLNESTALFDAVFNSNSNQATSSIKVTQSSTSSSSSNGNGLSSSSTSQNV